MSTLTFKRLPFTVELPNAPLLDPADISPLVPPPVLDLDAYWLFGADNAALADINGGNALQRNVQFTVTPGSGFTSAPDVLLTGYGGTGMAATAVINAGAGTLLGVVLTDPGINVSGAPTCALSGGGGIGATVTASLGAAPTLGAGYAELPDGTSGPLRNGLILPYADSANYTLIQVLRFDASSGFTRMWQGTLTASSSAGSGGEGLYRTNTGVSVRTQTPAAVALTLPAAITDGAYFMVAQSFVAGAREVIFVVDGELDVHQATGLTKTLASPLRRLAIGNGYYTASGAYPPHRVAAAAYKAGPIDHDYLRDTIYPAIRDELAARGITLI